MNTDYEIMLHYEKYTVMIYIMQCINITLYTTITECCPSSLIDYSLYLVVL